jgi:hypothetical protein
MNKKGFCCIILSTLILLLLPPVCINGQSDFRQGYIINNNFDTLYGLIDYRGDIRNSNICVFKASVSAPKEIFKPEDIIGYRFVTGKFYISKNINTGDDEKRMFVEYLLKGIVDLYYYRDTKTNHYLIQKADGKVYELMNDQKIEDINGVKYSVNSNKYISALALAFSDCMEIQPQVRSASLDHMSLINVTKNYHNMVCKDQECIVYEKQLPAVRFRFAPVAGFRISNLKLLNKPVYNTFDFEYAFYPSFGGAVNIAMPRMSERIFFQFDVNIGKRHYYSYSLTNYSEVSYSISKTNLYTTFLEITPEIKYAYPRGKLRPVFLVGYNMQKALSNRSARNRYYVTETYDLTNDYYNEKGILVDLMVGLHATAGIDFDIFGKRTGFVNFTYEYMRNRWNPLTAYTHTLYLSAGILL